MPTGTAGRAAADEVNGKLFLMVAALISPHSSRGLFSHTGIPTGTPYGRPEDVIISDVTGQVILYFTATSEDAVYSVIFVDDDNAMVQVFADQTTLDIKTGAAVGSPFNNPDNLAIDAFGHVYIIEDQGPDVSDIWQAVDADGDGVAEQMGRFLSNGVIGSEPTGFIFDPNTKRAVVAVQHPASGNDALWEVTLGAREGGRHHLRK